MLPELTLVLGGAASGKSAFAEGLAMATGRPRIYLATAQILDEEMRLKVEKHKKMRGDGWQTIEAPLDLAPPLRAAGTEYVILLDCVTMLLSNHLLAGNDPTAAGTALMDALAGCAAPVIIVSNEVGLSVVPENALARRFVNAQGAFNQRLAAQAGLVVNVTAGLPQVLKGAMP